MLMLLALGLFTYLAHKLWDQQNRLLWIIPIVIVIGYDIGRHETQIGDMQTGCLGMMGLYNMLCGCVDKKEQYEEQDSKEHEFIDQDIQEYIYSVDGL